MKKGLLSILAGALLVVGCQNYDDQFDALESQINALASTVAGLSQVQSDLASLSATVGSLQGALQSGIDAALADGLADMVWVIMGMCNSVGIDFDKIWAEVKSSNMSKFVDGKFIKNDAGKIMKPETYFKPNIKKALGL